MTIRMCLPRNTELLYSTVFIFAVAWLGWYLWNVVGESREDRTVRFWTPSRRKPNAEAATATYRCCSQNAEQHGGDPSHRHADDAVDAAAHDDERGAGHLSRESLELRNATDRSEF